MGAVENKKTVQEFLSNAIGGPANSTIISELLTDDCKWWIIGDHAASGLFEGKESILNDILSRANDSLYEPGSNHSELKAFIAEGDHVAVEWVGGFTTVTGHKYQNTYCAIFEMDGGKIKFIREYNDPQQLKKVLD